MINTDYEKFISGKHPRFDYYGFEPKELNKNLFPFQRDCVEFAVRKGRSAMFLDTGLGKTLVQLSWADCIVREKGLNVLVLCPLAVAPQTQKQGERFGIETNIVKTESDVKPGISLCNYERVHLLDLSVFGAVVLDESSILKSYMGKTKQFLVNAFSEFPYRLACTATPSPNDHMEIGNHGEFLGVMPSPEMLARFFINDTMNMGKYRLKNHAVTAFWDWCSSWARGASTPSDLGDYDDTGYVLPGLTIRENIVASDLADGATDALFRNVEINAASLNKEKAFSLDARVSRCVEIANSSDSPIVIWCETNEESDRITAAIPGAIDVHGSQSLDTKESRLNGFSEGDYKVLVTKAKIAGFGMNWQHCNRTAFASVSYSFESIYQAVRRFYRFGQTQEVEVDVLFSETERSIWETVKRKQSDHERMKLEMRNSMRRNLQESRRTSIYENQTKETLPKWLTA
jgi:superfamily II DNA or RNA helicase